MIDAIIRRALAQRFLVILGALGLLAFGIWSTLKLNLDAFPDVTNIQVQVNTQAPGLAAVDLFGWSLGGLLSFLTAGASRQPIR